MQALRSQSILLGQPNKGWESKKLRFLSKENPKHILRKITIFDQARVFHFFWVILRVFYTTTEQKWVREKVISPLKMSVCDVPPNQKFKLVSKKKIILNLFYGCVWRSWHLFCCPKCRTAHSQYSSSSGQHFRISLSSQRGRLFICRCFDQGQLFLLVCTNINNKIQNITRWKQAISM